MLTPVDSKFFTVLGVVGVRLGRSYPICSLDVLKRAARRANLRGEKLVKILAEAKRRGLAKNFGEVVDLAKRTVPGCSLPRGWGVIALTDGNQPPIGYMKTQDGEWSEPFHHLAHFCSVLAEYTHVGQVDAQTAVALFQAMVAKGLPATDEERRHALPFWRRRPFRRNDEPELCLEFGL